MDRRLDALVEPYLETTLSANCSGGCPHRASYAWTFDGADAAMPATASGESVTQTFETVGTYAFSLAVTSNSTGVSLASYSGSLLCRYVRREIRQLSDADRERFFDAMQVLWSTRVDDGRTQYGDAYVDIYTLTQYHVTLSSDRTCDHMHDGLGFLTQHSGLTLAFEQALQAVDPKVSCPYWDFTIDRAHLDAGNWSSLDRSPVWRDDWFGSAKGGAGGTVTEGRWAYVAIDSVDADSSSYHNSYGYLRAPWNNNNRPYLTRSSDLCGQEYHSIPTCSVHHMVLETTSSWTNFAWQLPYRPHGPVHMYVGGTLDCNGTFSDVETYLESVVTTYESASTLESVSALSQWQLSRIMYLLRTEAFVTLKNMYRGAFLTFPSYCASDTPYSSCKASCTSLPDATSDSSYISEYWDTMFYWSSDVESYAWLSDDIKVQIMTLVCDGGIAVDGDSLESGSPMDPSFWPIHPTMERLWLFKKLAGGFTDEAWPSVDYATVDGCHGHKAGDVIPFRFSLKTQSSLSDGSSDPNSAVPNNQTKYTNEELYNYMASGSPDMPYVYQDFNWDHCNSVALNTSYDFAGLVTSWQQSTGLPTARA